MAKWFGAPIGKTQRNEKKSLNSKLFRQHCLLAQGVSSPIYWRRSGYFSFYILLSFKMKHILGKYCGIFVFLKQTNSIPQQTIYIPQVTTSLLQQISSIPKYLPAFPTSICIPKQSTSILRQITSIPQFNTSIPQQTTSIPQLINSNRHSTKNTSIT
jgi:hypothetical protein